LPVSSMEKVTGHVGISRAVGDTAGNQGRMNQGV
jgi:hypothetical protein